MYTYTYAYKYVCTHTSTFIYWSEYLFVCLLSISVYIYLCIYLFVCLPLYLYLYLSIYLSNYLSIYLSLCFLYHATDASCLILTWVISPFIYKEYLSLSPTPFLFIQRLTYHLKTSTYSFLLFRPLFSLVSFAFPFSCRIFYHRCRYQSFALLLHLLILRWRGISPLNNLENRLGGK